MPAVVTKVKETRISSGNGNNPNAKYTRVWAGMAVTCCASVSQCESGLAHFSCRLLTVTAGVFMLCFRAPGILGLSKLLPGAAQLSFWSCVVVVHLIVQGCT